MPLPPTLSPSQRSSSPLQTDHVHIHAPVQAHAHAHPGAHQRPISRDEKASMRQTVYLVRCAHCDTFFTDRGMKAVLLLKPHVTLFSTDAMPSHCSPIYPPETLLGDDCRFEPPVKERTCNCLTQTLGCNGCGAIVGYNVVSPCVRCTQNVAKHAKGPNGYVFSHLCNFKDSSADMPLHSHRIVFHCNEITTSERRYIPGDRGVKAMGIPPRLALLLEEQALLEVRAQELAKLGKTCPLVVEDALFGIGEDQADGEVKMVRQRLWRVSQHLRMLYDNLLDQYHVGARLILAGETLSWADLVEGGERTRPFCPDKLLDLPMAGR